MVYRQSLKLVSQEESGLTSFIRDSLRPISFMYLAWLTTAIFISYIVYIFSRSSLEGSLIYSQAAYYFFLIVHVCFRLRTGGARNVLAPDVIFVMFYTLFHLGYVTLYVLKIVPYSEYIFHYTSSVPKALCIINIGLIGFLFGYELMGKKQRGNIYVERVIAPADSWYFLGVGLMMVALLMHFAGLYFLGFGTIMHYGYSAIQNATKHTSYWNALLIGKSTFVMVTGMSISMIANSLRHGKLFHSKLALGLAIVYAATVILEGERGSILSLGIPLLLIRHYFVKKVQIKYLVVFFLAAIVLFSGLRVVRTIALQPAKMLARYQEQKSLNPESVAWYSAFVEMGASFLVVDIVASDVPSEEPYWKGASWRDSAIHIVPFLQGFTLKRGWSTWSPSEWVTLTYFGRNRAGRAFTVAAEGFLNFGFPGVFIELMVIAMFIRWLTVKFSRKPSAMWGLIMIGCYLPLIMVIRNHLNVVTNKCAIVIITAVLLNLFLGNEPVEQEPEEIYTA